MNIEFTVQEAQVVVNLLTNHKNQMDSQAAAADSALNKIVEASKIEVENEEEAIPEG